MSIISPPPVVAAMLLLICKLNHGLDNGVARTPPMGWISWERFECNTECDTDPDNCISEHLLKAQADAAVAGGFRDAGYTIIAVDDCWMAKERDESGRIVPDPLRFPSGMKALADYMHTRGLLLGVYGDVGTRTCAGFPGSENHWETDAQTFADWGVDFLKFDACNADIPKYHVGFPAMKRALNATGRHIIYSCEWPMYEKAQGGKPDYPLIAATCNLFRQLTDIYDSWGSVIGMIEYFGDDPGNFSRVAGPGAWNDPDQVVIGNFGLSEDQERVQMALYAILASPMFMSNDLRNMRSSSRKILLNKAVIAVSQDPLGIQGKRVLNLPGSVSVWTRPVLPPGSWAVAVLYTQQSGGPRRVSLPLASLGLNHSQGYDVEELFDGHRIGRLTQAQNLTCFVNPTGVVMVKATAVNGGEGRQDGQWRGRNDRNTWIDDRQGRRGKDMNVWRLGGQRRGRDDKNMWWDDGQKRGGVDRNNRL